MSGGEPLDIACGVLVTPSVRAFRYREITHPEKSDAATDSKGRGTDSTPEGASTQDQEASTTDTWDRAGTSSG